MPRQLPARNTEKLTPLSIIPTILHFSAIDCCLKELICGDDRGSDQQGVTAQPNFDPHPLLKLTRVSTPARWVLDGILLHYLYANACTFSVAVWMVCD